MRKTVGPSRVVRTADPTGWDEPRRSSRADIRAGESLLLERNRIWDALPSSFRGKARKLSGWGVM
jgi:hypothetical protein